MKQNQNCELRGTRVILVPYRKEHVQKYHEWMESLELRQATASERLSLDEEARAKAEIIFISYFRIVGFFLFLVRNATKMG